jgi:hypothetical protein
MADGALKWIIVPAAALAIIGGCTSPSVRTHPVAGKVEIKDGDVAILTGSYVELRKEGEDTLRPGGNIDAQGNFVVKTIHEGNILPGAPEGQYKARIILGDPSDDGVPKRKGDPIHKRFLEFETSKLMVTVPSADYTISLSKK